MKKNTMKHVMEYASDLAGKPRIEGRIAKDVLLLGKKSQNRNRIYGDDCRERAVPLFLKKSAFINHTEPEKGQKYYRRKYNELLGTVIDARNTEDGIRGDIALSHHADCDRFIKDMEEGLPVAGWSPEMNVEFDLEAPAGEEWVKNIVKVDCVALTSCPATATLIESVIEEEDSVQETVDDEKYAKRRQIMESIEAALLDDENPKIKITEILNGFFPVEETVVEPVVKEEVKPVQETTAPEIKCPVAPDFTPVKEGKRLTSRELFSQIWK
jgi:hypothetical protein